MYTRGMSLYYPDITYMKNYNYFKGGHFLK